MTTSKMHTGHLAKAAETAKVTGLSKFFLYRLAAQGEIPFYRAGRAIRFNVDEVLAWMKAKSLNSDDYEVK